MGQWLDSEKKSGYLTTVLQLKPGQSVTIRLLDNKPPVSVWRHSCRDASGKFVKALCVGNRNGCKLCAINADPKYSGLKNKDKPYPVLSEYVKPVYVYEEKRVLLVVSNQIWKKFDVMIDAGINVMDRDFTVVCKMENKQTFYDAIHKDPSKFAETIDPATMPTVESYLAWLTKNVERVAMIVPSVTTTDDKEPTPEFLNNDGDKGSPEKEPEAPEPEGKPEDSSPERAKAKDALARALAATFDVGIVNACQGKIMEARLKANPQTTNKNLDFDYMSTEELVTFVDLYQKATAGKKKKG